MGLLFTHKNGDVGAISVTERSCVAPISKVERHISDRVGATPEDWTHYEGSKYSGVRVGFEKNQTLKANRSAGTLLDDLDVCERPGAPNVNFRKISVRKTI